MTPPGPGWSGRVEPGSGLVLLTGAGTMSFAEWEATVRGALGDPAVRRPLRILSDRRRQVGGNSDAMTRQITGFLRAEAAALAGCRWAVLAAGPDAVYGAIRKGETLAEWTPVDVRSFLGLDEALDFLLAPAAPDEVRRLRAWVEAEAAGRDPTGPRPDP